MTENRDKKPIPQYKEFDIKIAADGVWYHEGGPIKRKQLVQLFATVLSCDATGQHWLRTPVEYGPVSVEDAAFLITAVRREIDDGQQKLIFTDNIDREYVLGAQYRLVIEADDAGQPKPYLLLDRGVWGKLSHPVYYELAELADESAEEQGVGVYSSGMFFALDKYAKRQA